MNWLLYLPGGILWMAIWISITKDNDNKRFAFGLLCELCVWIWVCLKISGR